LPNKAHQGTIAAMPTDLHTLAGKLRLQLLDLDVEASAIPNNDSGGIELRLSPTAAQALSQILDSSQKPSRLGQEDPAEQEWEARSERVSEIEGFTGGEASE
jgi:hypothetical protein